MRIATPRFFIFLLLTLSLTALGFATAAAQPIYKVEDSDGNIIYTDEKPEPDAEPLDLPELGVLGEEPEALEDALEDQAALDPAIDPLTLVISQPADGSQLSDHGGGVGVVLHSNIELPPSAQIVLYINDEPQDPIRQMGVTLTGLVPGDYRLHAEVQAPSGRVLAQTEEVSFLLRAPPRLIPAQ